MNRASDITDDPEIGDSGPNRAIERGGEPCTEAVDAHEPSPAPAALEYLCREWGAVGRAILLRRTRARSPGGSQDESSRVHPGL